MIEGILFGIITGALGGAAVTGIILLYRKGDNVNASVTQFFPRQIDDKSEDGERDDQKKYDQAYPMNDMKHETSDNEVNLESPPLEAISSSNEND